MRVALAKYSMRKTIWRLIVTVGITLLGFAVVFYRPPSPTYGYGWHVTMVIAGLASLGFVTPTLWQLGFDEETAIWLEGDRIVYLNGWYHSVDVRNVESISIDIRTRLGIKNTSIVLKLHNGRPRTIFADWFSEPAEELVTRLRGAIADIGYAETFK